MRVLIAKNFCIARNNADCCWGWRAVRRGEWLDQDGKTVTYISDVQRFQGMTISKIYYGYGYEETWGRDDVEYLQFLEYHHPSNHRNREEEELREKNPTLMHTWKIYQRILNELHHSR